MGLGPRVTLSPTTRVGWGRLYPGLRTLLSFKGESKTVPRGVEKGYVIVCLSIFIEAPAE